MNFSKDIKDLTIELAQIPSIVGTHGEKDIIDRVYNWFMDLDYFKQNKGNLNFVHVEDDPLARRSVTAFVEGEKEYSSNTVVIIAHTDTVGIEDYGVLEKYATKPNELVGKLKELSLPKDVEKDLKSGDYLFGRGVFDMKFGVATSMILLREIIGNIKNLKGNILFAAVCDEEASSAGMLSVVPKLVQLKESKQLNYLALVNTDYSAPRYVGDENRYVYVGTVGKLMPSFYIVGKETHVGEPFKGLDPNEISSSLVNEFNLNMEYCDIAEGEVALPPITLRQQDLKEEYSVQTSKTSYLYFNYATHMSTPDEVMEKILTGSKKAFSKVIGNLNHKYETYCKITDYPYTELPWKPYTLSYDQLLGKVREEKGSKIDKILEDYSKELLKDSSIDERSFSLKLVEKLHSIWSYKEPVVIAYFSPPYYPHIYVEGAKQKEKSLINAINDSIHRADNKYPIKLRKFYPYISDLSYGAAPSEEAAIISLENNMPGYGSKYTLPLKEMQILNLPVVNIGPFGKDAHKFTERLETDYSFNILPGIIYNTIMLLLEEE